MSFAKSVQQDALSALCETVKSSFGIVDSIKCVIDPEGDEVFIKDVAKLLGCLHIEHPVGQFVVQRCQSYADNHGCGVKSFIIFMGQLYTQVKLLLQHGIQLEDIETLMHRTIDECILHLEQISFPVLCQTAQQNKSAVDKIVNSSGLELSRINEDGFQLGKNDLPQNSSLLPEKVSQENHAVSELSHHEGKYNASRQLVYSEDCSNLPPPFQLPKDAGFLSHGCSEAMILASKIMQNQFEDCKISKFDLKLVHTVSIAAKTGSFVVSGIVLETTLEQLEIISSKLDLPTTALLINGDLTENFRHKGYRKPFQNISETLDLTSFSFTKSSWPMLVLSILKTHGVNVLLIKGTVDLSLKDLCVGSGIVVITSVPYYALYILQHFHRAELVTYISDTCEKNLCKGLILKSLHTDWMDSQLSVKKYFTVSCLSGVQTVVFSHPSQASREIFEQEFWLCAHRLAQASEDGIVLPGEGMTEHWCANYLLSAEMVKHQETEHLSEKSSLYNQVVREALSQAFEACVSIVQHNKLKAGDFSDPRRDSRLTCCNYPTDDCLKCNDAMEEKQNLLMEVEKLPSQRTMNGRHSSFISDSGDIEQGQEQNFHETQQGIKDIIWLSWDGKQFPLCQLDTYSSKVHGWRQAVSAVFMVLKMDSMIITGVDAQTCSPDSVLF